MNKIINVNNLRNFCYLNDLEIKDQPKGLIIEFRGLGGQTMFDEFPKAKVYSEHNILYMVPYLNPWNWMNKQGINEIEEMIDVIKEKYHLDTLKIASTGGSMGGLSALTYAAYAKTIPSIVIANCPVCDLEYHYSERPDLPRTLYAAFYDVNDNRNFFDVLNDYSPIKLAEKQMLPQTKYVIYHCEKDSAVNINQHTKRFIKYMDKYDLTFKIVPNKDHCDLDEESLQDYQNHLLKIFL